VVHVDPEHAKHDHLVTCLVSMQAMEELRHFQLPGIAYRYLRQWASESRHGISMLSNGNLLNEIVCLLSVACVPPSDNPACEEARCGGSHMWSAVVRPVGHTAKFSKKMLEAAYGSEMNITFSGKSSDRHSRCHHANCKLPQNLRYLWHCVV
jgi:hypothetical protein